MKTIVHFEEGVYNAKGGSIDIAGMSFPLVKELQEDATGPFLLVDASGKKEFPDRTIRVRVKSSNSFRMMAGTGTDRTVVQHTVDTIPVVERNETDSEIKERLRHRFQMLTDMTQAAKEGHVRAVIVSGPPGVGKSFGVEAQLAKSDLFQAISSKPPKYEFVKGAMSALGLYAKLHQYKDKGNVVVFDDCDSVLFDDLSLNILKAALDSGKRRTISWNTDSRLLMNEGIPNKFDFDASVIFITNIKFDHVRSKKLRDHLSALESRCHYLDLTIDTEREKVLRIKQIVEDGMLREYEFEPEEVADILKFIDDNKKQLRELSLRTVLKIADLRRSFKGRWKDYAMHTVMK